MPEPLKSNIHLTIRCSFRGFMGVFTFFFLSCRLIAFVSRWWFLHGPGKDSVFVTGINWELVSADRLWQPGEMRAFGYKTGQNTQKQHKHISCFVTCVSAVLMESTANKFQSRLSSWVIYSVLGLSVVPSVHTDWYELLPTSNHSWCEISW